MAQVDQNPPERTYLIHNGMQIALNARSLYIIGYDSLFMSNALKSHLYRY